MKDIEFHHLIVIFKNIFKRKCLFINLDELQQCKLKSDNNLYLMKYDYSKAVVSAYQCIRNFLKNKITFASVEIRKLNFNLPVG
jgi:hypothetical protein